jgi:hypothetical protein
VMGKFRNDESADPRHDGLPSEFLGQTSN